MQKLFGRKVVPQLLLSLLVLTSTTFDLAAQINDPLPYQPQAYTTYFSNFVRTWEAAAPVTDANTIVSKPLREARQTTQYLDGLGRPLQTVIKQGSLATGGSARDLVSAVEYDAFGREVRKYLPFASATGDGVFKSNPFSEQKTFYDDPEGVLKGQGEAWYYGRIHYEASPLGRVQETFAPGNSWVGTNYKATEGERRSVKQKYWINTAVDEVRIWTVAEGGAGNFGTYTTPAGNGTYGTGELYKNVTEDEHGKQVIEFKDKEGKVILKKVQLTAAKDAGSGSGHAGWLSTYYIYDDLGQLRCVIQPKGIEELAKPAVNWNFNNASVLLLEQCFRYEYDERGRMIVKKVPGAAPVQMVYDKRDRLVLTQDGNLGTGTKQWLVTLYDELNRPIKTGLWTNDQDGAYHRSQAMAGESFVPYPFSAEPATGWELLSETGYDSYATIPAESGLTGTFNDTYYTATNFIKTYNASPDYAREVKPSPAVTGLVTWTRVKVLGTVADYIYAVNLYDDRNRVIQVKTRNVTQGEDILTTQYDFAGRVLRTHFKQQKSGTGAQEYQVLSKHLYDDLGRLLEVTKALVANGTNYGEKTLVKNEYDALGQLKKKTLGVKKDLNGNYTSTPLETLDYAYNIRGWLLGANREFAKTKNSSANYFGFDLGYDKTALKAGDGSSIGSYGTGQYNGNISGTVWKSKGDNEVRKYNFSYDAVNRLAGAAFDQHAGGSSWSHTEVDFTVDNLTYDANGNILSMDQKGLKIGGSDYVDKLRYDYRINAAGDELRNKLQAVYDAVGGDNKLGDFTDNNPYSNDYTYDENGNLTWDYNKGISSITYNYLNLPVQVTVAGKGTIRYTYDAAGNKLKKVVTDYTSGSTIITTTTYIGGVVYESRQASQPSDYTDRLQFLAHEEGRIRPKRNTANQITGFEYDYFVKDHLGNVRMVLTEEKQQDIYPAATLEGSLSTTTDGAYIEKEYYTIDPARVVSKSEATGISDYQNQNNGGVPHNPNPNSQTTANSQQLYKLRAESNATGGVTGLGMTLKVMGGDKIDLFAKSYYFEPTSDNQENRLPFDVILNGMFGAPNSPAAQKATATAVSGVPLITNAVTTFLQQSRNETSTRPKAYINWIFLDENFRYVAEGSSFDRVGDANVVKSHSIVGIPVSKSGYLYVYASNESPVSVFFDNVQVVHTRDHILEETHYYPFGLTMQGISSKAAGGVENKRKWNKGSELENKEFSDGSGLELYSTFYRSLDPQLGRFWQIDPRTDYSQSLYSSMGNNPIRFNDPLGDSINNPIDQRIAARIEGNINRQITSNNQSIANSQNTITSNNAQLTKLKADVASGTLTGKDLKRANKDIGKLESANNAANANIAEMQSRNAQLSGSLNNITALRNDVNFNYTFGGAPGFGSSEHGVLRGTGNNVIIQGSDDGLYVHEIRHIGQSLDNGGLRFSTNPLTLGRLLNAGTNPAQRTAFEVDAYRAQFSLDRNSYPAPGGARVLSDINSTSLRTILGDNGAPLY